VLRLLVTANVAPSSLILVSLMMEAIRSSETSVLTRDARRHIPEDDILQCRSYQVAGKDGRLSGHFMACVIVSGAKPHSWCAKWHVPVGPKFPGGG
jgi:hypothetical protein